jgi:hypothetical protein
MTFKRYLLNSLIGLDQFINALIGGDPDMTLSGRMGRAVAAGRCKLCKVVCWALDKIDTGHCARSNKKEADEGADQVAKV